MSYNNIDYRKSFSNRLNFYLKSCGKNQTDLIRDLNVSSSTASNWCTGQKMPRMGKIQQLADYFNIKTSDLTDCDEDFTKIDTILAKISFAATDNDLEFFNLYVDIDDEYKGLFIDLAKKLPKKTK